jgi:hypothetical protein
MTATARLNTLATRNLDGVQIYYTEKYVPNFGPGWFIRYASGLTRWIGRNASAAAEWIDNA